MKLSRFWQTLEESPGGADVQHDWRQSLGDQFPAAEQLLRRTGRLASVLSCPSSGGDYCPRRVVHDPDGSIVAICGNRPRECDLLHLTLDDVAIFELDIQGLAGRLAQWLNLRPDFQTVDGFPRTWQVGRADIAAGCSFPIYLTVPTEGHGLLPIVSGLSRQTSGPFGLLIPTRRPVSAAVLDALSRAASDAATLEELIEFSPLDGLVWTRHTQAIFPRAWAAAQQVDETAIRPWILPPDAKWENLVIEFLAEEMLHVTFRQETRTFEPIDLGMRDHRNKRPTEQWILLKILAMCNGSLNYTPEIRTQKKFLSKKLRASFGLCGDPVPYDRRTNQYRARFIIRGTVLRDLSERRHLA